ncbi:MAG: hypothetical protein ABWX84_07205 [Nocardioides sp.]
MRQRLLLPIAALLVGAAVSGCSDDKPAVCTSIDELESSMEGLSELELTGTGVAGLEDQLARVAEDYDRLRDDAKEEYGDQVDAIDADLEQLKTTASEVEDSPSAAAIAAVKTSVQAVVAGVDNLADDVKSTC